MQHISERCAMAIYNEPRASLSCTPVMEAFRISFHTASPFNEHAAVACEGRRLLTPDQVFCCL